MREYEIETSLDKVEKKVDPFKDDDPFRKSWDDLKSLKGFDPNFKRKATRMEKGLKSTQVNAAYKESSRMDQSGIDGAKSKTVNPGDQYANGYSVLDVITPPYNLYELANFYDTNFANHAAIDAKVENVVGLGYEFHATPAVLNKLESLEDKGKRDKAKKRIENHKREIDSLLDRLNDDDTFTEIMDKFYTDVQATGNGYLEVGRTVTGEIGYIGHIPSTTMRVRRLRDGFVQIIGNQVVYFRNYQATNGNPLTNDPRPNEVIHYKEYSPLNTFYGVPDIISALQALVGENMAAQYNIDYFENKATPRYVITLKGAKLSEKAEDRMFRFLQNNLKGQNHRTLFIPLPADSDGNKVEFDMRAVENGVQEASFDKYRKSNRDDILAAHQVPLSKLGGSAGSNLAGALAQDRTFKEQFARPEQRRLEKVINKILREFTDILELRFKELTLTDEVAQSQIYERYLKTQTMLPNEVREALGLPAIPGGDKPFELSPKQATNTRSEIRGSDQRAQDRLDNNSDSVATTTGRNPKGEGRSAE